LRTDLGVVMVAVTVLLATLPACCLEVKPTVVIYTGVDTVFARMLANLTKKDSRIGSETRVVGSPDLLALAAALPGTECIVAYASNKNELEGLSSALTRFYQGGGAVIGLREICYQPSAGDLATLVFPTYANASRQQYASGQKRVRNYTKDQSAEINSDLPDEFPLVSAGFYLCAYANGTYAEVPGNYTVLYRDGETGAPIVLTQESPGGGRSVAFPGIWVISSTRVDVYYGRLLEDGNFTRLFSNALLWAAKGSTHYKEVSQDLDAKLEVARSKQQRLVEQAEKARRRENTRRIIFLLAVWAAGLLACAVIVRKIILAPFETGQ